MNSLFCCSCHDKPQHEDELQVAMYAAHPTVSSEHRQPDYHEVINKLKSQSPSKTTQAEQQEDKKKLQAVVKEFVHDAVYGRDCEVVDLQNGQAAGAQFALAGEFTELRITPKAPDSQLLSCKLTRDTEVMDAETDPSVTALR
eukprot:TRINITY_DN31994_c0_g1_i2.p1 TRINITY_DN31994_c0_g1~~TRINITY_DN31994_c0_g1_i2.p1  ORF type:complete len:143 (+),score=44.62 TRINITY_DN31994_c0_g1_i2:99-527(+)